MKYIMVYLLLVVENLTAETCLQMPPRNGQSLILGDISQNAPLEVIFRGDVSDFSIHIYLFIFRGALL